MLFQHLLLWAEEKSQLYSDGNPSVIQDSDHIFHSPSVSPLKLVLK